MGRMPLWHGVQKNPVKPSGDEKLNASSSKILSLTVICVGQQKMELAPFCTSYTLLIAAVWVLQMNWVSAAALPKIFVCPIKTVRNVILHVHIRLTSAFILLFADIDQIWEGYMPAKNICLHMFSENFFAKFPKSSFFLCAQLGQHET